MAVPGHPARALPALRRAAMAGRARQLGARPGDGGGEGRGACGGQLRARKPSEFTAMFSRLSEGKMPHDLALRSVEFMGDRPPEICCNRRLEDSWLLAIACSW